MSLTPEQRARLLIDAQLTAAGWVVQDFADIELTAARGVAVREVPMKSGFGRADYLLYLDKKAVGAVEAKAAGTLTGVEAQTAKYAAGLPDKLPAHHRPLPFLFESNGTVIQCTNGLDPKPRSRPVFAFPRPETLAGILDQRPTLRARLQGLPPLDDRHLWRVQKLAITNLERSLAEGHPRALIQMATGSGKTFTAVNTCYRLLKFAKVRRILFLVDRANLGKQTFDEFGEFTPPDDPRKFPELYTVQRLTRNAINPAAHVVITTIQRLYSMLKGDAEFDEGNEEGSAFDVAKPWQGEPPAVAYHAAIPPEFFDVVIVDECHRSIYDLWAQVLLYFDSFLVGLTATPGGKTFGFFNQNLVMQYGHAEAVADQVNVQFDVWRIRTRVTEGGATITADTGIYVDKRHKLTRAQRLELLTQDLTYTANDLDRDVVSESQLRTVLREFKERVLPAAFPTLVDATGARVVPKTLIFAKDDSHADDIVRMVREVFAEGNDFCEKITYRTGFTRMQKTVTHADGSTSTVTEWVKTASLTPDEILANFRTGFNPRIAVTVDMIATGTDVKPIECVVFMRNVKSAGFFEQMKGRGVRVITPDKLRTVTPGPPGRAKERFIIVDAVGVCEQDRTDSCTLNRKPSATLEQLLEYVAQGGIDSEELTTLAGRLARLAHELTAEQHAELRTLAGDRSLADLAGALLRPGDADAVLAEAQRRFATTAPSDEQLRQTSEALAQEATTPFAKPALRRRILEIRRENEQTIDKYTVDEVLTSEFSADALAKAQATVADFRAWITDHRDELTALQILYAGTKPLKVTLTDLRQLSRALAAPPLATTPTRLWQAFELAEARRSAESGSSAPIGPRPGEPLADLVVLVRHALTQDVALAPYAEAVRRNYDRWIAERESAGVRFTPDQRAWLDRMADHLATSLTITPDALADGWFGQQGGLGRAAKVFGGGDKLAALLAELGERLVA